MATVLVPENTYPLVIKFDTKLMPNHDYMDWMLQQVLNKVFYCRWLQESTQGSRHSCISVMVVGPETNRFLKIYETFIEMARQDQQWESLADEIKAGRLNFQLVKPADITDLGCAITACSNDYQELLASAAKTRAIFQRLHDTRPTDTVLAVEEWKAAYSRELSAVMHPDIFMEYMTRTPSGWDICPEVLVVKN